MPDSTLIDSTGLLFKNAEPFYPLQETIYDIQEEMADLRARIIDYESRVRSQDNSIDILHKIQYPHQYIFWRFHYSSMFYAYDAGF